jgi:hypothetical protein
LDVICFNGNYRVKRYERSVGMNSMTLKDIFLKIEVGQSILKLKKELIQWQATGQLFIRCKDCNNILAADLENEIEMYHCLTPGTIQYRNAFPVPITFFNAPKAKAEQVNYLRQWYFNYYYEDDIYSISEEELLEMNDKARLGKWIWYYKRAN